MEEDIATIYLNHKTDLMAVFTTCPNPECNSKFIKGVPYAIVSCGKCGTTYKTVFNLNIYDKKARMFDDFFRKHDGIRFVAEEKYEPSLIHIQYNYKEQKCWDVSEIESTEKEHTRCDKCGICYNCFTCNKCGESFPLNQRKKTQKCPKCSSTKFSRTYFKEAIQSSDRHLKLCPKCKSLKIKLTQTKNKTKCHLCGTTDLVTKKINESILIIKRKLGYR